MEQEQRRQAEQAFTDAVAAMVDHIGTVQTTALAVQECGGSVREAFLGTVDADQRAGLAAQWPMFALMLGVSPI